MKLVMIFLTMGALTSAQDDAKWTGIVEKMGQIGGVIQNLMESMAAEAKKGNDAVGAELETYLASTRPQFLEHVAKVMQEVQGKTLTFESAKIYFLKMKEMMVKVREEMQSTVAKLPEINRQNIGKEFENSMRKIATLAHGFLHLLEDGAEHKHNHSHDIDHYGV